MMNLFNLSRQLLLLALLSSFATFAKAESDAPNSLATAYSFFQRGDYSKAIEEAKKIENSEEKDPGTVAFFLANAYAKQQQLENALPYYRKAITQKYQTPSLQYDYGQALFATHSFKEAELAFKRSIVAQFKVGASAYYIAFMNQLQDETAKAKDFYGRVQKLKSDPDKVKQPSLYQLAEIESERISEMKKNDAAAVAKAMYVSALPLYRRARDFAPKSAAGEQADSKIKAIEASYSALAARMRNGNPMPTKPYTLRLSQDVIYDSNVVTQAEQALIEVSNKDSFISKTGLLAKYQLNFRNTFSVTPELNTSATYHLRRSTPRVYQNDNISLSPALRNKYEHTSRGQPATTLADLEFNLMLRDYLQQHRMPFYSRYFNFILGERLNWFATGSSTVKVAMKLYESYDPGRNFYSPQLSLQQNIKLLGKWDLSNTFTAEYTHARDDINDEKNYKLRQSATLTRLFEKVDVTPSFTLNLKDTMKQKGSRGNELLISPAVELARNFVEWLETAMEYTYTKNNSKSKTQYQYSKHELRLTAAHAF